MDNGDKAQDGNNEGNIPFGSETNAWLHRKARIHWIWVSFVAGLAVFWLIFSGIIQPINESTFNEMVNNKDTEIGRLRKMADHYMVESDSLRNRLDEINSYGVLYGTYTIGESFQSIPVWGNKIIIEEYSSEPGYYELFLAVDTNLYYRYNRSPIKTYLPVSFGNYSQIRVGEDAINITLVNEGSNFIDVAVYKSTFKE